MKIVLATLNSRYSHASLALRCLYANLGNLQPQTRLREFTISQPADWISEQIRAENPQIVGLGVYIWNTAQTLEIVRRLKSQNPSLTIVLGGPEVSYESETQEICQLADHVIQGEGDLAFRELCEAVLEGRSAPKFIRAPTPELSALQSPYPYYTDEDVRQRNIYVEASRGCPYECEFCLSSLDETVRNFSLESFLGDLDALIGRGARKFKFIDRTFNLSAKISTAILRFFLERVQLGLFLHFELVPDRLPAELKELIEQFPPGSLQFEIGIQTFDEATAGRIKRRQNYPRTEENLRYLIGETGVYVHADLIAGLPGEAEDSFAQGFDRLAKIHPHEIQVGILKRLKGTPIIRHDSEWTMRYDTRPPFAVLETSAMDAQTLKRLTRFSKTWDRLANSGRFPRAVAQLRETLQERSLYATIMDLSEALYTRFERTHSIGLNEWARAITEILPELREVIAQDLGHSGGGHLLHLPKRQRRHQLTKLDESSPL